MKAVKRIMDSIRDGTFIIKICNRLSKVPCIISPEWELEKYFLEHYPVKEKRAYTRTAQKTWIHFRDIFEKYQIHDIAYVGAHEGGTAIALNDVFDGLVFHLIEPAPATFRKLVENLSMYENMHCINVAAGAENEELTMFIDRYSGASSLLPYESLAIREYPFLCTQDTVKVPVKPLDEILHEQNVRKIDLLIIDAQGFEDHVILGADETLHTCSVVVTELSLQKLYVGSSTFDSVYQALARKNYHLIGLMNPMEGQNHQILQIDGIFARVSQ